MTKIQILITRGTVFGEPKRNPFFFILKEIGTAKET